MIILYHYYRKPVPLRPNWNAKRPYFTKLHRSRNIYSGHPVFYILSLKKSKGKVNGNFRLKIGSGKELSLLFSGIQDSSLKIVVMHVVEQALLSSTLFSFFSVRRRRILCWIWTGKREGHLISCQNFDIKPHFPLRTFLP